MKPKIYIFSIFNWRSDLLHREHMLAQSFSRLGYEVFFIERNKRKVLGSSIRKEDGINVLTVFSIPYFKGIFLSAFMINDWLLRRQLTKYVPHDEANWLLLSSPLWIKVALEVVSRKSKLIYDMSDNHLAFTTNKRWFKNLKLYEDLLLKEADVVFLSSANLAAKVPKNTNQKVFGNGVDLEKFSKAKPLLKSKYKGKIVGFVGGIYERIDLGIIEECSLRLPEITFVLVGPTDRALELKRMKYLKNFHYLGPVHWPKIQDYFASFDIGIIPFVAESEYPWLKTVDSVKIYQYAYFGYPIVTTQFGQIQELSDLIKIANDKSEFVKLLSEAVLKKEDSKIQNKRKELAIQHDWTKIANEMTKEIYKLDQ